MSKRMSTNSRTWAAFSAYLVVAALVSPAGAQQPKPAPQTAAPIAAPAPVAPPAPAAAAAPSTMSPSTMTPVAVAPAVATTPAAPDAAVGTTDGTGRSAKSLANVPHELSPWSMFMSADIIVKIVMVGLAFASLVTWTVFIGKFVELTFAQRRLRVALDAVAESRSIADARVALGTTRGVLPAFLAAALREARLSAGISSDTGIKERVASSFAEIARAEARRMRVGMGLLATIGATSPFVGLFGTVWGIMNSFIGISKSQTTNLAVVAPGIAEALLATAIGLVAAIPAVIFYNHFARVTKGYMELVSRASGAAGRLLSRDLDRTHVSSVGGSHSRTAAE